MASSSSPSSSSSAAAPVLSSSAAAPVLSATEWPALSSATPAPATQRQRLRRAAPPTTATSSGMRAVACFTASIATSSRTPPTERTASIATSSRAPPTKRTGFAVTNFGFRASSTSTPTGFEGLETAPDPTYTTTASTRSDSTGSAAPAVSTSSTLDLASAPSNSTPPTTTSPTSSLSISAISTTFAPLSSSVPTTTLAAPAADSPGSCGAEPTGIALPAVQAFLGYNLGHTEEEMTNALPAGTQHGGGGILGGDVLLQPADARSMLSVDMIELDDSQRQVRRAVASSSTAADTDSAAPVLSATEWPALSSATPAPATQRQRCVQPTWTTVCVAPPTTATSSGLRAVAYFTGSIATSSRAPPTERTGSITTSSRTPPIERTGKHRRRPTNRNRNARFGFLGSSTSTPTGFEGFETAPNPTSTTTISSAVGYVDCTPAPVMPVLSSSSSSFVTVSTRSDSTCSAALAVSTSVSTLFAQAQASTSSAASNSTPPTTTSPASSSSISTTFTAISTTFAPLSSSAAASGVEPTGIPLPAVQAFQGYNPGAVMVNDLRQHAAAMTNALSAGTQHGGGGILGGDVLPQPADARSVLSVDMIGLDDSQRQLQPQAQPLPGGEQCWVCQVRQAVACLCIPCYLSRNQRGHQNRRH